MKDWDDPYMLDARPEHVASEAEQEDFLEKLGELGLVAAHLGATLDVHVTFKLPPKRKQRVQ